MADEDEVKPIAANRRGKLILIYAGVAVIIFLLGLIPMAFRALARSDPAAADRLSNLFTAYHKALGAPTTQR
jgi:hypothetical protein